MAKRASGITVEIGGDTSKLSKALGDVTKTSKDLQKELRGVNTMLKYDPKNVVLLQQKQDILTEAVANTEKKLKTLKEAQSQVQKQFEDGEITVEQYRDFQREIEYTERRLRDYKKELSEVSAEHRTFKEHLEKTAEGMQKAGDKMQETGRNLTKKVTLPLVGIGTAATALGVDFEKSMSEVQAVSGATADEMVVLEAAAREAGATTDKSARDAADALQYMALAGWDVEDSQKALIPMLKLSSAANMDLGRTSDLVTDTMSTLGLEINDLDHYLDVLAETSRNSNTDVDALGEAFLVVGSRLDMLDVPLEEGATALGLLADNGIKGSEAGRGLNAVLTNLTAPTGRAKDALEELGVSAFDSNGEFIGIEQTLQLVEDATKDMTQEQKNMYYSMIAGKEHSKTFNALMGNVGEGFQDLRSDIMGAEGALDDMYNTATDNTLGAFNNLKSSVEELALKIWDNMQPAIEKATEVIQKMVDKFNGLSPEMQETIVNIGLVAAAIGPLLSIGGKLIGGIGKTIENGIKLGGHMQDMVGIMGGLTAPSLGTVAAVAGIAAAVGALIYVIKNWGEITEWIGEKLDQFKEWVSNTFGPFFERIAEATEGLREIISTIVDGLVTNITELFTLLKETIGHILITIVEVAVTLFTTMAENVIEIVTGLATIVENIFQIIYTVITTPIRLIRAFAKDGFTGMKNEASAIFNELKTAAGNIFRAIFDTIRNIVTNIKNSVINIFKSMVNGAANVFRGFLSTVRNIFTNIGNTIKRLMRIDLSGIGRDIIRGLADGIRGAVSFVSDAVASIGRSITNGFKSFFGIRSPSRLMRDVVGKMIPQGIAVGVEADTDEALDAVDKMNEEVLKASDQGMVNLMTTNTIDTQQGRMDEILGSVSDDSGTIPGKLDRLADVFERNLEKLSDPNYRVVLDNGVLVGELKNDIDHALGRTRDMKGRGN